MKEFNLFLCFIPDTPRTRCIPFYILLEVYWSVFAFHTNTRQYLARTRCFSLSLFWGLRRLHPLWSPAKISQPTLSPLATRFTRLFFPVQKFSRPRPFMSLTRRSRLPLWFQRALRLAHILLLGRPPTCPFSLVSHRQ